MNVHELIFFCNHPLLSKISAELCLLMPACYVWHRPLRTVCRQAELYLVHVATVSAANIILFLENGACNEVNIHNTLPDFKLTASYYRIIMHNLKLFF
jgi:hypothetical protein